MRILFVDPPVAGKLPGKKFRGVNPSLSIASLAAVLVENGHQVSLFDMVNHYENREIESIKQSLNMFKPDVVGFSILNAQYVEAVKAIKAVRAMTDIPILAGGSEVSAIKEKIFSDTDYAVNISFLGEAEESLVSVLKCIEEQNQNGLEKIDGIIINRNGETHITAKPQPLADLNSCPPPNLEIFGIRRLQLYKVMGSRGCPYNCSFCFSYLGKSWRGRRPEQIVKELLDAREKYKISSYRFLDPIFNFKPDWVRELCALLKNSELAGMPWEALGVRADALSGDVCSAMADAGCVRVAIGVESLHPEVFRRIKKGETIEQVKQGVKTAVAHINHVSVFMIIGLPGDNKKRSLYSYDEIKKLNPSSISYALAVPYSGTRLEQWANEEATVLGSSYDSFTRQSHALKSGVAFETEDFTADERLEVFKILNTKECRYVSSSDFHYFFDPVHWLGDALKHDMFHMCRHARQAGRFYVTAFRRKFLKSGFVESQNNFDACNEKIEYIKVPDGTWWV